MKLLAFVATFSTTFNVAFGQEAAPGPGSADDAAGEALSSTIPFYTIWEVILSGGWVMIPLGVLSLIGMTLVIVYLFSIRRSTVVTDHFMHTADALLKKGDLLGLLAISVRHNEAVARVVQTSLEFATKNPHADFRQVREVASTEGTKQASNLNQQITYLSDVGTIAPMVGLFGTVIGMIRSFSVVASDVAASRPLLLAEGVSVALVTTATGLIIGIPALACYAYFRGQVQKLIAELEASATHVLAQLAVHYDRPGVEEKLTAGDRY